VIRVDGKTVSWHDGMTVSDLLMVLADPYPYAVVRINGRYVSKPDFDRIRIPDDAEVRCIPLISGG
jgi:sulfur carrier protein ThiS